MLYLYKKTSANCLDSEACKLLIASAVKSLGTTVGLGKVFSEVVQIVQECLVIFKNLVTKF